MPVDENGIVQLEQTKPIEVPKIDTSAFNASQVTQQVMNNDLVNTYLDSGNAEVANTMRDMEVVSGVQKENRKAMLTKKNMDAELKSKGSNEGLHTAMREVIPFMREAEDDRPIFTSFAFEDDPEYDIDAPEVKAIFNEVGNEYAEDLREAKSMDELLNTRDQIMAAQNDMKYMEENHGFVGSMALYAIGSLADPSSYVGYGLFAKGLKMSKIASKMNSANKYQRSAVIGGYGAIHEGASEYYIQSHGARQYESVAFTMLAAGALGGGGSLWFETLRANKTAKQQKAFEDLGSQKVTIDKDPELARKHMDTLYANESIIAPYRSAIVELFPTWMKDAFHSPSQKLYEEGGLAARLGELFDTPAGLSATEGAKFGKNDELIQQSALRHGKTAQDVKEEILEALTVFEYRKQQDYQAYKKGMEESGYKPLTREEYDIEAYAAVAKEFQIYKAAKLEEIAKIKKDYGLQDELAENVDKILKSDETYIALKTDEEKIAYRDKAVEAEIDIMAAQRTKQAEGFNAWEQNEFGNIMKASNEYYGAMKQHMVDAGIPFARSYDEHMYQPVMYDKDMVTANKAEAIDAIEAAILNSAEHKQKLIDAMEKLKAAELKLKDSKSKQKKEIEITRNKIKIEIQSKEFELAKLEKERKYVEDVLSNPYISPLQKSIELNRVAKFTDEAVEPTMTTRFRVDDNYYIKHQLADGTQEVLVFNKKIPKEELPAMTVKEFDNAIKHGIAEPLSKEDFRFFEKGGQENAKDIRLKVQELVDEFGSVSELMTATGTRIDDIVDSMHSYSDVNRRLGFPEMDAADRSIVTHELLHNLTREIKTNPDAAKAINELKFEIAKNKDKIIEGLKEQGIDPKSKRWAYDETSPTWESRIDYMSDLTNDEMFAVAFSNPEIAKVLNSIESNVKIDGKNISILDKLFRTLIKALGIKRLNSKSILGQIVKITKSNARHNPKPLKAESKIRNDFRTAETELRKIALEEKTLGVAHNRAKEMSDRYKKNNPEMDAQQKIVYDDLLRRTSEARAKLDEWQSRVNKLEEKSNLAAQKLIDYHAKRKSNVEAKYEAKKQKIEAEISNIKQPKNDEVASAYASLKNINKNVRMRAEKAVENISDSSMLSNLGLEDGISKDIGDRMKGRKLNVNTTTPALQKFIVNNNHDTSHMYHYGVSGRASVQHATGFQNVEEYRRYIVDNFGTKLDDTQVKYLVESFELMKGTKQIPSEKSRRSHHIASAIKSLNYISMGGQFASYGISEIGAGVYATGLRYLRELIPALGTLSKMYRGKSLTKHEFDLVRLVEAGEIYMNNSANRFGDAVDITDNFNKAAKFGTKASRLMFRISGLEGITVITKSALPNAFIERIIAQAGEPRSFYDLIRWGIQPEDMVAIAKQPILRDEKTGRIVDFQFDKWDSSIRDKFQTATSRMARDTILKPTAMRVPVWLQNGETNVLIKLAGQFMSFGFMAHERLLLRGLSEDKAMAFIGMMTSMGILAAINMGAEQVAVSSGVTKDDDRKFDISTEKGLKNLAKASFFRNSFVGLPHMATEILMNDVLAYNGGQRVAGRMGGVSVGRGINMLEAAKQYTVEGKVGTAQQVHVAKTLMPFNNLVGVDAFTKQISKDWYNDSKERNFYQDTGFKGLAND